jgi:hypothetical protein
MTYQKSTLILAVFGLAAFTSAAMAEPPACGGSYEVVRNSTIKPGKMALFLKAVHDHQTWYADHGLKDRILVGRILSHDADSGGFSSSSAMTIHTDLSQMAPPAHAPDDAAWNAYVEEYKASSDLTNTSVVCMEAPPK